MDEPVWLNPSILEAIHTDQIKEHGGRRGLQEAGLLESALARPRQQWAHRRDDVDLASLAAAYAFGIIENHPFVDGNERSGFVAAGVFLLLNGYEIEAPEPEVVEVVMRVAGGQLDRDGLADWIRASLQSIEP